MAQSGMWFGNLFNWWLGSIINVFYLYVGTFLSIFGLWDFGTAGMNANLAGFAMADMDANAFTKTMTISG